MTSSQFSATFRKKLELQVFTIKPLVVEWTVKPLVVKWTIKPMVVKWTVKPLVVEWTPPRMSLGLLCTDRPRRTPTESQVLQNCRTSTAMVDAGISARVNRNTHLASHNSQWTSLIYIFYTWIIRQYIWNHKQLCNFCHKSRIWEKRSNFQKPFETRMLLHLHKYTFHTSNTQHDG